MIKYMPSSDPQRAKLVEASRIAQKIAKCEIDDSTRRAAVMHCLERSVEDFPVCILIEFAVQSLNQLIFSPSLSVMVAAL